MPAHRHQKWHYIKLALLVGGLLVSVMLGTNYWTQGQNAMSLNVEFTDQVTDFGTESGYVSVLFAHQAAGYRIAINRDDFADQVRNLAAAWKSGKSVKVVVERGVQIQSITMP